MTAASIENVGPDCEFVSHLAPLYRVALQLAGDPADAQDLVLDTVANAFAARSRPQPGTSVRAWLYRRLIRPFITASGATPGEPRRTGIRDGGRQEPGSAQRSGSVRRNFSGTGRADAAALEQLTQPDVAAALRALPVESRILVYLADVEGFGYNEITQLTGIRADTMVSRLHRGRARLRQLLAARAAHAPGADKPDDPERLRGVPPCPFSAFRADAPPQPRRS